VLHEYGLSVNQQFTDNDNAILAGASPLHLAAYYGRTESAQMLLKLGADINVLDHVNGQTPLHVAVMQSQTPIITLLRNAKANVSIQDRSGNTAASYVSKHSKSVVSNVLADTQTLLKSETCSSILLLTLL